ncbi:hypothetical protein Tco_0799994, partial [Tanacetum coccineum]
VTKEPPSRIEGETEDMETRDTNKDKVEKEQPEPSVPQREGKGMVTDDQPEQTKLVKASSIVRPNPDALILVPYTINGKLFYLTEEQIQAHLDKEDLIKKAEEEAKRLGMTKTKVGEKFKKAQDAELQVHKRQHTKKVKRLVELNKKRAGQYMRTMSNRLKPEPITDVKIHTNSKPAVLIMYRNNDKRNFEVPNPFKFGDFGITELDELGPIIEKKKNSIVKDLMTSLGKRYERLKKIPEELRIQSAPSQSSGRKRRHMELEPEIRVPGLECNRSLPKGLECNTRLEWIL